MSKKYLSFVSLAALALMAGGLLAGCGIQPSGDSTESAEGTPSGVVPLDTATTEPPAEAAPVITDAELDKELKDMDASLDTVKTTGFEAANLADKDLGI